MKGQISSESEVISVPAGMVWDVYGGLKLGKLVDQLLPHVIGRVDVVEGDGGVGTVVKVTHPPGTPGIGYMMERFTKIDDQNHIKETELVEGGFKELGFHLYRIRLEIIDKDTNSTVIRSTIEYEVEDEFAGNASLVTTKPLETIAQVIDKYLSEKKINA
ncbi:hypothetical protein L1049_003264 [Liquidambar formosana]|uniref:Bet v I/Major latex protein domain-containing protein n=1 Tax=Liquidambar formosana TaxID=63359 RepID=A0AAP0NJW9_LIQFO